MSLETFRPDVEQHTHIYASLPSDKSVENNSRFAIYYYCPSFTNSGRNSELI